MANIRDALRESNPWWTNEFSPKIKEREIYQRIQKFMPLPQIIALTGLRRVGKTLLLYKIVVDSIRKVLNVIIYSTFLLTIFE